MSASLSDPGEICDASEPAADLECTSPNDLSQLNEASTSANPQVIGTGISSIGNDEVGRASFGYVECLQQVLTCSQSYSEYGDSSYGEDDA